MHTCEVRIELIPEDADYCYTHSWWYQDDIGGDPLEFPEFSSLLPCGAPATKKVGFVWVCDPHYKRNGWIEEDDREDPNGNKSPIVAIFEGGDCGDDDEDFEA